MRLIKDPFHWHRWWVRTLVSRSYQSGPLISRNRHLPFCSRRSISSHQSLLYYQYVRITAKGIVIPKIKPKLGPELSSVTSPPFTSTWELVNYIPAIVFPLARVLLRLLNWFDAPSLFDCCVVVPLPVKLTEPEIKEITVTTFMLVLLKASAMAWRKDR